MAVAALRPPAGTRRGAGILAAARTAAASGLRRLITPHRAALRNLADIPLTVLGASSIDFAGFHIAHGWGWLVTGVSLVIIEHLIADADEPGQPGRRT